MRSRIGGELADAATGVSVNLRSGRGPRIIVAVHGVDCAECAAYVARLSAERAALAEWGGRLTVVANDARHDAFPATGAQLLVAADTFAALGVEPPALVIADEWGEVYSTVRAGERHDFPAPADVIDWIRFIAIQCPECEQPEGAWRD